MARTSAARGQGNSSERGGHSRAIPGVRDVGHLPRIPDEQFAAGGHFSLGKSRREYGPIGPCLVTPDELADPDDLAVGCSLNGEQIQHARTSDLIFGLTRPIAELSAVLPLLPGDVIFTDTPAGIGAPRQPPVFLDRATCSRHGPKGSDASVAGSSSSGSGAWSARQGDGRRLPKCIETAAIPDACSPGVPPPKD